MADRLDDLMANLQTSIAVAKAARLASTPHLDSGADHIHGTSSSGYSTIDAVTVCGRTIACTLVARQPGKVRCPECRQKAGIAWTIY